MKFKQREHNDENLIFKITNTKLINKNLAYNISTFTDKEVSTKLKYTPTTPKLQQSIQNFLNKFFYKKTHVMKAIK